MKKIFFGLAFGLASILLVGCSESGFKIEGQITNAEDSVLYFENIGIEEVTCLDSAVLDKDGDFLFKGAKVTSPEFYRLRIANQIISLCVDSAETITIKADFPKMATDYTVEGNDNCKRIKELSLRQMDLRERIIAVTEDESLSSKMEDDSIYSMIQTYKEGVCKDFVFKNPSCASSYFALFQTIGGMLIFNPSSNADDVKAFAAVATSWDTFYPGATRGVNLHNITIEGMNNTRGPVRDTLNIDPSKIETTGLIDIALPDNKGKMRRLTDLKGKVILLHFNIFNTEQSPTVVMQLRDLYDRYHDKGFEIYQVSLDENEHFWKTTTSKLPWICVRDNDGESSKYIPLYNVQGIPSYYLIDRSNTLKSRDNQIKDLSTSISALL